ncbi:MAG: hypothetical protein HKN34_10120 [Gammaproteobacteria bacterium]|nr:hypothetical protein [Gammaproteobacteria bacterium]
MDTTTEDILAMVAALPGLYGFVCWIRRVFNAQRAAGWAKANYPEEWNNLHWLAQRNNRAGVEILITKGLISGSEVQKYRARDEYLDKSTWVGLFISAILLLVILVFKFFASLIG